MIIFSSSQLKQSCDAPEKVTAVSAVRWELPLPISVRLRG
jgi:hypothetical protein